jgi:hypothetical protein
LCIGRSPHKEKEEEAKNEATERGRRGIEEGREKWHQLPGKNQREIMGVGVMCGVTSLCVALFPIKNPKNVFLPYAGLCTAFAQVSSALPQVPFVLFPPRTLCTR